MYLKRIFDIFASLLGLIISSPILITIGLLIKIKMSGPILFKQQRVGQNGKLFTMIKFRTMTVSHHGSSISVKGESRITPLGAILRKYKLDELPELWNVLKGDMSLVGPRPDVTGYADKLEGDERKILQVKPGITGPASIKYRNEEELLAEHPDPIRYNDEVIYPDKVQLNLEYMEEWNFLLDVKLILWTVTGRELKENCAKARKRPVIYDTPLPPKGRTETELRTGS